VPQLVVQPAGNQGGRDHYRDTVATPVPLDRIRPLVDEETRSQLDGLFPDGTAAVWGVTPGATGSNERRWQRIGQGDVAVFLKESRAYAMGAVALKTHSSKLALDLWGTTDTGQTWEYVYFLRDVRPVNVSYAELNTILGYEPANQFQGFNVIAPERSAGALARLGFAGAMPEVKPLRYWWVNQGTSFREESAGGFVWAPKLSKGGVALAHYTNVSRLRPDDVIVHYANGSIRAISRVSGSPEDGARPTDAHSALWNAAGHIARTMYRSLKAPIPLADIPHPWRLKEAGADGGPFTRDASVKLGYLFPLSDEFVTRLLERFPELREGQVLEARSPIAQLVSRVTQDFERAGLQFERDTVARFAAALIAKPFVILTGLSGSGKTKLAQGFAYWLGSTSTSGRARVVAVGPDWTSKDSALGYPNALDAAAYARTPTLDLILAASADPSHAYFLILDEMNLSHVERYFADILSALESGELIHLHPGPDDRQGVPPEVEWPRNLFLVGTVNVDETTYMFSPKVLDRAHVLEFRATRDRLETVVAEGRRPDLALLVDLGTEFEQEVVLRKLDDLPDADRRRLQSELALLFDILARENYEFGYRTAIEFSGYARASRLLSGSDWRFDDAIDAEVLQKLLPRIHGSQRQIEPVLRALAEAVFEPRVWGSDGALVNAEEIREQAAEAAKLTNREFDPLTSQRYQKPAAYPLSFDKIKRMLHRLDRNGFTSFAEA
jgi:hypothetical protein